MRPTIGSIVIYKLTDFNIKELGDCLLEGGSDCEPNGGSPVCAAVIVGVSARGTVNLRLLTDDPIVGCPRLRDIEEGTTPGTWHRRVHFSVSDYDISIDCSTAGV